MKHLAAEVTLKSGQLIANKYLIGRLVGMGGMGAVYEAEHVRLNRRVAIKTLKVLGKVPDDLLERFEREARSTAQLQSPHVARVMDVDVLQNGMPFIVMEYLNGTDLAHELHLRGVMPIKEAVDIMLQACSAMAEAHALGIIHRDLKPSNLFLDFSSRPPVVKVLDFGISKMAGDTSVTLTSDSLGTPVYMSPEQTRSPKSVDARTDIWSLGIILYELITGVKPFTGETPTAVAMAVVSEPVPPPTEYVPTLPLPLQAIVLKALQKDVDQRYQDVAELARHLIPFAGDPSLWKPVSDEVILARSIPAGRRSSLSFPDDGALPRLPFAELSDSTFGKVSSGWSPSTSNGRRARRHSWLIGLGIAGLTAALVVVAVTRSAPESVASANASAGLEQQQGTLESPTPPPDQAANTALGGNIPEESQHKAESESDPNPAENPSPIATSVPQNPSHLQRSGPPKAPTRSRPESSQTPTRAAPASEPKAPAPSPSAGNPLYL